MKFAYIELYEVETIIRQEEIFVKLSIEIAEHVTY
jgi:hypothetical protein